MTIFLSSGERQPSSILPLGMGRSSSVVVPLFLFATLLIPFRKACRHRPAGSRTIANTTRSKIPQGQQQHTAAQRAVVAPASSPNRELGFLADGCFMGATSIPYEMREMRIEVQDGKLGNLWILNPQSQRWWCWKWNGLLMIDDREMWERRVFSIPLWRMGGDAIPQRRRRRRRRGGGWFSDPCGKELVISFCQSLPFLKPTLDLFKSLKIAKRHAKRGKPYVVLVLVLVFNIYSFVAYCFSIYLAKQGWF